MGQKKLGCENKGRADLLILEASTDRQFHGLAVEFKVGRDKLKPAQFVYFERLRNKGWRCEVVRSYDQFEELLHTHSPLNPAVCVAAEGQSDHLSMSTSSPATVTSAPATTNRVIDLTSSSDDSDVG